MDLTILLHNSAFDASAIAVIAAAYRRACRSLGLAARADPSAALVAMKMIEIAHSGERDPAETHARIVEELGVR